MVSPELPKTVRKAIAAGLCDPGQDGNHCRDGGPGNNDGNGNDKTETGETAWPQISQISQIRRNRRQKDNSNGEMITESFHPFPSSPFPQFSFFSSFFSSSNLRNLRNLRLEPLPLLLLFSPLSRPLSPSLSIFGLYVPRRRRRPFTKNGVSCASDVLKRGRLGGILCASIVAEPETRPGDTL